MLFFTNKNKQTKFDICIEDNVILYIFYCIFIYIYKKKEYNKLKQGIL